MNQHPGRWRLRPYPSPAELARMYATPHDHTRWADHLIRADVTTMIGAWLLRDRRVGAVIADLSTGNATIPRGIADMVNMPREALILGDFAPRYEHVGPIEQTIERLADDSVDLFVCSETIEHLEFPEAVLARIRAKARRLLLSTPIGETLADDNPEHIHGWTVEGVVDMLATAGWRPTVVNELKLPDFVYDFMILGCVRR